METYTIVSSIARNYLANYPTYSVKAVLDTQRQDVVEIKREEAFRLLGNYNDSVKWKFYKQEKKESIIIAQAKEDSQ